MGDVVIEKPSRERVAGIVPAAQLDTCMDVVRTAHGTHDDLTGGWIQYLAGPRRDAAKALVTAGIMERHPDNPNIMRLAAAAPEFTVPL